MRSGMPRPGRSRYRWSAEADELVVRVSDDGVGLDPGWEHSGHYGVRGMRERAVASGGSLQLISGPQRARRSWPDCRCRQRMSRTTVMLVDDHAVVRVGFRLLLQAAEDLQVVAEAESGEAGRMRCMRMPGPISSSWTWPWRAPAASRPSSASSPATQRARILALSAHEDMSHPKRALKAGALGYLVQAHAHRKP